MRNTQNHAWNLVQNLTMQRLVYWEKYSWHRCCQKPWTWIKVGLQHMIKELHALNLCKDWATDRSSESETMKAGTQTDVYCTWKHYDLPVYRKTLGLTRVQDSHGWLFLLSLGAQRSLCVCCDCDKEENTTLRTCTQNLFYWEIKIRKLLKFS